MILCVLRPHVSLGLGNLDSYSQSTNDILGVFSNQLRFSSISLQGTFPFPGQNVASLKHGGSCTSQYGPCHRAIDSTHSYPGFCSYGPIVAATLKFDQEYIVNKVLFTGLYNERDLTIKFSDGTTEKVLKCVTTLGWLNTRSFEEK